MVKDSKAHLKGKTKMKIAKNCLKSIKRSRKYFPKRFNYIIIDKVIKTIWCLCKTMKTRQ